MWMPLGWVSASGSNGFTASFELISTTVLGSSTPSVTFNLTSAQQTAYKHLQLRVVARTTAATTADTASIQFNGDTAGNYTLHQLYGDGTNAGSSSLLSQTEMYALLVPGANATASLFGGGVSDILDAQSTSKNKTVRSLSGNTGGTVVGLRSGLWISTAAISSVLVKPNSASNFATGSRFSLFGVRG